MNPSADFTLKTMLFSSIFSMLNLGAFGGSPIEMGSSTHPNIIAAAITTIT
jgi:hypothetical protein